MTETLGDQPVVVAIRDAIVRGDFVPNQRLVEADPSAQFSASRANVRAALIEAQAGALSHHVIEWAGKRVASKIACSVRSSSPGVPSAFFATRRHCRQKPSRGADGAEMALCRDNRGQLPTRAARAAEW